MRIIRTVIPALALLFLAASLRASEFDWIVRQISRETGARPVHIPFFGLARFVVRVGHPAGASDLHLAVFEDTHIAPIRFNQLFDTTAGPAWNPVVRVRSRKNGESTNIYAREEGKHLRLLICTSEHGETTLVEIRVQPDKLMEVVEEHRHRRD
jgi:hypothetical protein